MNTNDFSVCKVGDKLWSIELGECVVVTVGETDILCESNMDELGGYKMLYNLTGKRFGTVNQLLFFSNPGIIAPAKKEPLRLECECEWVNTHDGFFTPSGCNLYDNLRQFYGKRTRMIFEEIV